MAMTLEQERALALARARRRRAEAEAATADYQQPEPPPGVMIHGAGRSEISGRPDMAVDRTGMDLQEQQRAARALRTRADQPEALARATPFFQGLTLSGGDEAVSGLFAGAQALRGRDPGEEYRYMQEVQRQDLARERSERPVTSAAGQIAGNIVLAAPLAATGVPAFVSGSLARQGAIGGALGSATGAVEGGLAGEEGDRLRSAAIGAGVGGVAGFATPFAIAGARNVVQRGLDAVSTNRALRGMGLSRPSGDSLRRTLAADDALTPSGRGSQAIRRAGPDSMIADAGPATRGQLDTAIQSSPEAGSKALNAVRWRTASSMQRLTRQMDDVLGAPQGAREAQRNIRQGTATARANAYDAAYAKPIDYSGNAGRRIEGLLGRVDQRVIDNANSLMRAEGYRSGQILADVAEDGSVQFSRMPDVRQLDYIKRGLDDLATTANAQGGALGGRTQRGAAYENLARELRDSVADAVPEYRTALSTAADPIRRVKAIEFGRDLLRPRTPRDVARMEVDRMTPAELREARLGVRSYIDEVLSNIRVAASNMDNESLPQLRRAVMDINTPAAREKLRLIVPDRKQYADLMKEIDRASRTLVLNADIATGSRTAGRTAMRDAIDQSSEYGVVGAATRGKPLEAPQRAVQTLFGTTPQDDLAMNDQVYSEIVDFLTRSGSGPQQPLTGDLAEAYRRLMENTTRANRIGASVGTTGGIGAYQGLLQQLPE